MSLETLIRAEDQAGRMWAVLVEHSDGDLEFHNYDGAAMAVADRRAISPMEDDLLTTKPVACSEAKVAGLDLLSDCPRCMPS